MARRLPALFALAFLLVGCETLYDRYTPVVAEMFILNVEHELRDGDGIDFDDDYVDGRTTVRVYLSEADEEHEIGIIPAEGATVLLWGPNMGTVELTESGAGLYEADNFDGLKYDGYLEYELNVMYDGKERLATIWLPASPWADIPSTHRAGESLSLGLAPDDFDNAMAIAISDTGEVLYDDAPQTQEELLEFAAHTGVGTYTIPGEAFPQAGRMEAVGVAGVRVTRGEESFENFNHDLCRLVAGSMQLMKVEVE